MIVIAAVVGVAVAAGFGAERRYGARAQRAGRLTLSALLYGLLPFITFFNIARLHFDLALGAGLGLALVALALAGGLAWLVANRVLALPRPATGSVIAAVIQPNTGYFGLPATAALLGTGALGAAVAFDTVVSLVALYLGAFGVGAIFGDRAGETPRERATSFLLRNPPLIALILGLLAPDALAPDALLDLSRVLVFAVAPLGFFAVGVTLASEAEEGALAFPPRLDRAVGLALVGRLLVAPALLLTLAVPLIALPDAYALQIAMPSGINGLVVAHAYGLDLRVSAAAIAWSTAIVLAAAVVGSLP